MATQFGGRYPGIFSAWGIQSVVCERVHGLNCMCLTPNAWDLRALYNTWRNVLLISYFSVKHVLPHTPCTITLPDLRSLEMCLGTKWVQVWLDIMSQSVPVSVNYRTNTHLPQQFTHSSAVAHMLKWVTFAALMVTDCQCDCYIAIDT